VTASAALGKLQSVNKARQQGNSYLGDQKMIVSMGKRPRQQIIKCQGCEGDRMYKDCPHHGDKSRIVDKRKKALKPPFIGNISQAHQQGKAYQGDHKMKDSLGKRPRQQPIKCFGCEGDHMYKDCPRHGDKIRIVHNIKKEETIEDVGGSMPRIYATLENRQVDYQSHTIEVEGKFDNQPIVILIDSRSSRRYIDPNLVERFKLKKCKHEKSWLVQLATGTKRRINELVNDFPVNVNGINTKENLNIILVRSYDCLIGID
jgi:hypothetical protein